jgi:glycosyltransferase involved in cell wall biosynthesis
MLISIIIPVYNEELTVGNVIDRVKATMQKTRLNYEVLVVDDRSFDKSLQVIKSRGVRAFTLKEHFGKGYVLRAGFRKAEGDVIVTMDSDGSHRPEELPELLAPILHDRADLIIGSRYINHKHVASRKLNAFGVKIFNRLIQAFTGVFITDSQSGYRAMKREVIDKLILYARGYEIESEMLVKTFKAGFRVAEVPISFEQRTYGRSGVDPVWDGSKILYAIMLARFRG